MRFSKIIKNQRLSAAKKNRAFSIFAFIRNSIYLERNFQRPSFLPPPNFSISIFLKITPMKKLFQLIFTIAFVGAFFTSCKEDTICLECTITIAGLVEDKGKTCDDLDTINSLEAEYQDIVDRENSIVGQSATLDCKKYIQP